MIFWYFPFSSDYFFLLFCLLFFLLLFFFFSFFFLRVFKPGAHCFDISYIAQVWTLHDVIRQSPRQQSLIGPRMASVHVIHSCVTCAQLELTKIIGNTLVLQQIYLIFHVYSQINRCWWLCAIQMSVIHAL